MPTARSTARRNIRPTTCRSSIRRRNTVSFFKMPVRRPEHAGVARTGHAGAIKPLAPSAYWGDEKIWDTRANNHNSMFDKQGPGVARRDRARAWTIRPCARRARSIPTPRCSRSTSRRRQVAMLDPKTMKYSFIDTCFGTHHPQFGYDADDTLWLSGTGPVAGWVNTKMWDETGDAAEGAGLGAVRARHQRQRQARRIHRAGQAGGSGQGHAHQRRLRPLCGDAAPDRRLDLVHLRHVRRPAGLPALRSRRPSSASSTPFRKKASACAAAISTRTAWCGARAPAATSISFDRRKCKAPLNGPNATGNHCPEGFDVTQVSGPGLRRASPNDSAEASYYTWVDQHDTVGLGENVPISTANLQDGFVALKDGKMVLLRMPYPMGFYAKGLDGRIDDPNAGWKGRGLWSTNGDRTPWLNEGGKGSSRGRAHPGAARSAGALSGRNTYTIGATPCVASCGTTASTNSHTARYKDAVLQSYGLPTYFGETGGRPLRKVNGAWVRPCATKS